MKKKTIFSALLMAAGVAAVYGLKSLKKKTSDDEVHFIEIHDGENEQIPFDASEKPVEVQEICNVYPYLNPDFVEEVLLQDRNQENDLQEDALVTLQHTVSFTDHDDANTFEQIVLSSGYTCEKQTDGTLLVSRKLFVEQGAIVSDVFNIANQTAALGGQYLHYSLS